MLSLVSLVFLILKYQKSFSCVLKSPLLRIFVVLQIAFVVYSILLDSLGSSELELNSYYNRYNTAYTFLSVVFNIIPCVIFISIFLIKQKYELNDCYIIVLAVGMIQVLIVFITLLFPDVRNLIFENAYKQDAYEIYDIVGHFRMYGLANGYTYAMPLYLGLCILISYVLAINKSWKYYLLIPFYLIAIAVNARIALVSILIVPFVIFFNDIKKRTFKLTASFTLLLTMLFLVVNLIAYKSNNSISYNSWNWLNDGVNEIINYSRGELTGNISYLADTMWLIPSGIDILFGTGENIFGRAYNSSDIGYVVNMYYGGLVYLFLVYGSFIHLIINYDRNNLIERTVNISIIVYLLIANFKGSVFRNNEIIRGVLLLIIFSITYRALNNRKYEVSNDKCRRIR